MKAVNVLPIVSFGLCTNIMASSQFAIQQWKLDLCVNDFCNTAPLLSLPKVLLATAKTEQYNSGADGTCLRGDINWEKLPLSLYFKSTPSCWPVPLRVTILVPLFWVGGQLQSIHYSPLRWITKEELIDLEACHTNNHVIHLHEVNITCSWMFYWSCKTEVGTLFKEGLGDSGTESSARGERPYLFNGNPSALKYCPDLQWSRISQRD